MGRIRARKKLLTDFHLDYMRFLPLVGMLVVLIWVMSIHRARLDTLTIAGKQRITFAKYPRPGIVTYIIKKDDTLESIAATYNVSEDSIRWVNEEMTLEDPLIPDTIIQIPPTTGVIHTVERDETLESIAKKYKVTPEKILGFPYNEISEDRAFPLTFGQTLVIPDGVKP